MDIAASHHDDTPEGVDPRTERTLAAIVAASTRLLMTEGPDLVTHVHVAAEANVSRTTVYKHFPTRADLLRGAFESFGKPVHTDITGDLRTDLRAMIAHVVDDLADTDRSCAMAAMMERSVHDETVAEVRDGFMRDGVATFVEVIRNGIAAGEVRTDVDVEAAMGGLMGMLLFRRFLRGDPVRSDEIDDLLDTFIGWIEPR